MRAAQGRSFFIGGGIILKRAYLPLQVKLQGNAGCVLWHKYLNDIRRRWGLASVSCGLSIWLGMWPILLCSKQWFHYLYQMMESMLVGFPEDPKSQEHSKISRALGKAKRWRIRCSSGETADLLMLFESDPISHPTGAILTDVSKDSETTLHPLHPRYWIHVRQLFNFQMWWTICHIIHDQWLW